MTGFDVGPVLPAVQAAAGLPSLAPLVMPQLEPGAGLAGVLAGPGAGGFGRLVTEGLERVNRQLHTSQVDLQRLAGGDLGQLHHVMMRLEESRLSFQMMLQVRNRLLESCQELMRMQV